jgi:hypothetical protein
MKKLSTLLFALALTPALSFSQSTGFMSPTSAVTPMGFTNPTNAFVSDDVWTTVAHQSGCRCPFIYLSWDAGLTYSASQLLGPFGTTDVSSIAGSPTFLWGHAWTDLELSNLTFRLKIANPSTLIEQGYADFNFGIPPGATILGIEVKLEWHGDPNFTMEFMDLAQVNVYYTSITGISSVSAYSPINVYPNPSNGSSINLSSAFSGKGEYKIYSLEGKLIQTQILSNSSEKVIINNLPKGIYLVTLQHEKGIKRGKIIVQ